MCTILRALPISFLRVPKRFSDSEAVSACLAEPELYLTTVALPIGRLCICMGAALSVLDDIVRERAGCSSARIEAQEIVATLGDEACLQLGMLVYVGQAVLQLNPFFDKESYDVVEVPHALTRFKRRSNNLWFKGHALQEDTCWFSTRLNSCRGRDYSGIPEAPERFGPQMVYRRVSGSSVLQGCRIGAHWWIASYAQKPNRYDCCTRYWHCLCAAMF